MKNEPNNPDFVSNLPEDVADIAAMLDALGDADRASMPVGLAGRVGAASVHAMLHPEAVAAAAEAGAISQSAEADRDLVPMGLEDRVFEASRKELVGAVGLRLVGTGTPARVRVRQVWWRSGVAKLAAAIAIVGAGTSTFVAMRGTGNVTPTVPDVSVLAASFDSEMAAFYDLLESTPSAITSETGISADHSITDELLEWESL